VAAEDRDAKLGHFVSPMERSAKYPLIFSVILVYIKMSNVLVKYCKMFGRLGSFLRTSKSFPILTTLQSRGSELILAYMLNNKADFHVVIFASHPVACEWSWVQFPQRPVFLFFIYIFVLWFLTRIFWF